jgi:hypothetical protein
MPRDETTAIDLVALIGREAEIVIGRAAKGSPARARVVDHFGQTHYVMVEPDNDGQTFGEGERILLVRQEGENFRAITRGDTYLPHFPRPFFFNLTPAPPPFSAMNSMPAFSRADRMASLVSARPPNSPS